MPIYWQNIPVNTLLQACIPATSHVPDPSADSWDVEYSIDLDTLSRSCILHERMHPLSRLAFRLHIVFIQMVGRLASNFGLYS